MEKRFSNGLKVVLLGAAALAAFFYWFSSGTDDPEKIIEKAARKQARMSSYHMQLEIVLDPGKSECRYAVKVWFAKPDSYRVEVTPCNSEDPDIPQQVFVSDGIKSWVFSPEFNDFMALNPMSRQVRQPPFLLSGFFDELARAEKKQYLEIDQVNETKCYRLQIIPEFPSFNRTKEEVWLHKTSLTPVKIDTYDRNGRLRQTIEFYQFNKEPEIEAEYFSPTTRDI